MALLTVIVLGVVAMTIALASSMLVMASTVSTKASERTVMVARSSTQTAVPWPCWRSALVGTLITWAPAWASACGTTATVEPSGGWCAPSSDTFTG